MATITIPSEETTLVLNGTRVADFAAGDAIAITFPNEATNHTVGATGGVSIKNRIDADVADIVIRVLKYSDSDVFLSGVINPNTPTVLNGSIKRNFIRDGVNGVETYTVASGSITAQPAPMINNQDGEEVMAYTIRCRSAKRSL